MKPDPNIGRRWNSPYGEQVISEAEHFGGQDHYVVITPATGAKRLYRADAIEDVIKRNEYALTPEYKAEQDAEAELRKLRAERQAREDARAAQIDSEIEAFAQGKSKMASGKIRATLLKQVSSGGMVLTRKALIEQRVRDGARIVIYAGHRVLENKDESFLDESAITKTGMDYAEYFYEKQSQSAA